MVGEAFVQNGEIGIDYIARREVPVQKFLNEKAGLFDCGELEGIVEFVVIVQSR
jgi:hypothetical protein